MSVKIILASGSPRRRTFFEELGWDFEVRPSHVSEACRDGESPEEMVCRLSLAKARDVALFGKWTVGADTVVVIDGLILGKPVDASDAKKMLAMLQGRTHAVVTGVAVIAPDGRELVSSEKTDVTFRAMGENEIEAYVQIGESFDKAGAYAIQGRGTLLVERINGCYFNVVGLPLERLSEMLAELGWPLAEQWRISAK